MAFARDETVLVSIPANTPEVWWKTIDCGRTDPEWILGMADELLTEDGKSGCVRRILDAGGWVVCVMHWQSLFSNGLETGLAVLDEFGRRVQEALADEVEWLNASEMAQRTARAAGLRTG